MCAFSACIRLVRVTLLSNPLCCILFVDLCVCVCVCVSLAQEFARGNEQVMLDVADAVNEKGYVPVDHRELCSRLLFTCYMGTKNSSAETRSR
jgi:hypothetical protein